MFHICSSKCVIECSRILLTDPITMSDEMSVNHIFFIYSIYKSLDSSIHLKGSLTLQIMS